MGAHVLESLDFLVTVREVRAEQKLVLRIDDDPNTAARDRSIEGVFEVHRGHVGFDQPGVSADPLLRDFQHGRREVDSGDIAVRLSIGQALREQPRMPGAAPARAPSSGLP